MCITVKDYSTIINKVKADGWIQQKYRMKTEKKDCKINEIEDNRFLVFTRSSQIPQKTPLKGSKKHPLKGVKTGEPPAVLQLAKIQNLSGSRAERAGVSPRPGNHKSGVTPRPAKDAFGKTVESLDSSACTRYKYTSLERMRLGKDSLVIAYDTEFVYSEANRRRILSYQFSVAVYPRPFKGCFVEIIFIPTGGERLELEVAIGWILGFLGYKPHWLENIYKYVACTGYKSEDKPVLEEFDDVADAIKHAVYPIGVNGVLRTKIKDMDDIGKRCRDRVDKWRYYKRYINREIPSLKITLLSHCGKVDISAFKDSKRLLARCLEVQGGLVSEYPLKTLTRNSERSRSVRGWVSTITFSDTMCHAPAGKKSLEHLGKVVNVDKIHVSDFYKARMDQLLQENPVLFFNYASRDTEVTLKYAAALYGYNKKIPVTMTSAGCGLLYHYASKYLEVDSKKGFNEKYRGLRMENRGLKMSEDKTDFIQDSSLEPISHEVKICQDMCSGAYRGGYNACFEVGYFPFETRDFDLKNAYPTAMCLVPDIDWNNPIVSRVINRAITLDDFMDSDGNIDMLKPFAGYVSFDFPYSVRFPCISMKCEGVPVYPSSSEGESGVYTSGVIICLALILGADVYCHDGMFMRTLKREDGSISHCLSSFVTQLVQDRKHAQEEFGKGSLQEQQLKTCVNAGYGKVAQNVVQKTSWSAFKDEMRSLGCSKVTSPYHAMMITHIVQAELLATLNQLHSIGKTSYSVTTDGFISDCTLEELDNLDMYGLKKYIKKARLTLTNGEDDSVWEIKHHQNDLINFTTRGNVSLSEHGVCAHNSIVIDGVEKDSLEDRKRLYQAVISREGRVLSTSKEFAEFKKMVRNNEDFYVYTTFKHISADFDMKRKPCIIEPQQVEFDGESYDFCHVCTRPFDNVEEFIKYRRTKKNCKVLRTHNDWNLFLARVDEHYQGFRVTEYEWDILRSVIMGYRAGLYKIPGLDGKTVKEKIEWINKHNDSGKEYTVNHWKNAARSERQARALPENLLTGLLEKMQNDR